MIKFGIISQYAEAKLNHGKRKYAKTYIRHDLYTINTLYNCYMIKYVGSMLTEKLIQETIQKYVNKAVQK